MQVAPAVQFAAARPVRQRRRLLDQRVPSGALLAGLFGWLCADELLLWRFLGATFLWPYAIGLAVAAATIFVAARAIGGESPTMRLLLVAFGVALVLYALGGEGRLFYANPDWRVRDGVLRDMAVHPWPYAYLARGVPEVLRAPLGLYLVPALVMKVGGQAAGDLALLVQDTLFLTALLGLGARLFEGVRARAIALATFLSFSGLDVVGTLLAHHTLNPGDHLEWWSPGLQYSSTVTLAFWVPQHALAGWTVAALYLLWRSGRLAPGALMASLPLVALWSPLAALGGAPFVAAAGIETARRRDWTWRDVALPLGATVLSLPSLLYMAAAGDSVGAHVDAPRFSAWVLFEMLEVVPFLFVVFTSRGRRRFGVVAPTLTAILLLGLPWVGVGFSADLMMRASIPALVILALLTADELINGSIRRRIVVMALLGAGGVTGFSEGWRALTWPASPPPLCSFFGAWGPSAPERKSTYLAPISRLPALIRPDVFATVPAGDPAHCWARDWPSPVGSGS